MSGNLLVASPVLMDPNFHRTVVLLIEHNSDGAIGIVLNRPTSERLIDHLPMWAAGREDDIVRYGGPVDPAVAIALAQSTKGESTGVAGVSLIDLDSSPEDLSGRINVYSGYAGWEGSQLEAELAEGAWYLVPALPDDPFYSTTDLWRDVLKRQGNLLSVVSTYTDEAGLN